MAKITYANKVTLNPQPSIADENKVTDDDMNEIKDVVNTNDNNTGDLSNLATNTKSSIVEAINELKNAEVYSTTEINTGKKWIDGKPIYRTVFEYGTLPNAAGVSKNHNIINIDKIIHQEAIANNSEGMTYSLPHVAAPNMGSGMTMAMRTDKTNVYVYCSSNMTSYTAYFIIEYTKITD